MNDQSQSTNAKLGHWSFDIHSSFVLGHWSLDGTGYPVHLVTIRFIGRTWG
jgi:hypothetical protein